MSKVKRFAMGLAALTVVVLLGAVPAAAQSPSAAPTAIPAETSSLATPAVGPDTSAGGPSVAGLSVSSLFMRADPLVKAVLIVLLIASLLSWMIIFNKWIAMARLKGRADRFEKAFWSGASLDDLFAKFAANNDHPFTAVFVAGLREWRRAFEHGTPRESQLPGIKDRVAKAMSVTISREADVIESSLGFLASVASTAPFVGLFGTVWGIMNSFSAIAARHDTTLAVVAPGIAEALFATAMGLLAAIPAAFFYNSFVAEIGRYTNRLDTFADELSGILSRQLDEKAR
jgi:biopolymer transport protein TolQ